MQASQLGVLLADAQAKSSAAAGTANGTGSKAKAGKVVFGATGNRLLDKQQADKAAKPAAPKPEVLPRIRNSTPRFCTLPFCLCWHLPKAHVSAPCSCGSGKLLSRKKSGACRNMTFVPEHTGGEEGGAKIQGICWQAAISEGLTSISTDAALEQGALLVNAQAS